MRFSPRALAGLAPGLLLFSVSGLALAQTAPDSGASPAASASPAVPAPAPAPSPSTAAPAPMPPKVAAQPERKPESPPPGTVALTFDDLPGLSLYPGQAYVDYLNIAILHHLARHHFVATGFVNESKLNYGDRASQIANLRRWLDAGMDLGNHTFSHESPSELGEAGYIADIAKGEVVTKQLLAEHHKQMRWFRHPYLETGTPLAVKQGIDRWLAEHHYRIAPVTIDADDWEFAEPYDDALSRHDAKKAAWIREEYIRHSDRIVRWARKGARALFGRDIAYVWLLHATRLNADSLDELAAIIHRENLKVVSLDKAMQDPAYRTYDPYVGKDGIAWLDRWAIELRRNLPNNPYADPPKAIEVEYNKVDDDLK